MLKIHAKSNKVEEFFKNANSFIKKSIPLKISNAIINVLNY